jgi:hypothetical protein
MGVVVRVGSQSPRAVAKKRDKDGIPSRVEIRERVGQPPFSKRTRSGARAVIRSMLENKSGL